MMVMSLPWRENVGFAERNQQIFVGRLNHALRAVEKLALQHEHGVVVAHGGLEQSLGIARGRGHDNLQTRYVGVPALGGVGMRRAQADAPVRSGRGTPAAR